MNSVPSRESEELEEQIDTLKTKCENLEDHVAEKEEEFEETLWKWQEFQSDVDTCFRNLAMIEKSLDFQSLDDGELEDRRETHQVRTSSEPVRFRPAMQPGTSTRKLNCTVLSVSVYDVNKTPFCNFVAARLATFNCHQEP